MAMKFFRRMLARQIFSNIAIKAAPVGQTPANRPPAECRFGQPGILQQHAVDYIDNPLTCQWTVVGREIIFDQRPAFISVGGTQFAL